MVSAGASYNLLAMGDRRGLRPDATPLERAVDLTRLASGDKIEWDRFVRRAGPVIYAALLRRLAPAGAAADADDVAQEVFLRLCKPDRPLAGYDPARASLSTFLTVLATSAAIDHLRRRRPVDPLDSVPEERLAVAAREPVGRVQVPDGLLTQRQRLVLALIYDREMEVAEAAEFLGVNPQTIRSTHHKAMLRLRAHFAGDASPGPLVSQNEV
ncbi:MAG TPA: sigma-70 family RNA polymerase sigma factor [Alphaproteobacteria bacterium]|nr:sigma-70 family RNA polymerase sigma factor [Alphaproteobacteria bacterium]